MKARTYFIGALLVIISLFALAACQPSTPATPAKPASPTATTAPAPAPAPAPTTAAAFKWPDRIDVLVQSITGGAVNTAWGSILTKQTNTEVRSIAIENIVERMQYMKANKYPLTSDQLQDSIMRAMAPEYAQKTMGPFPYRAVWALAVNEAGYATQKDSPIKTPADLKGKRVIYLSWGEVGKDLMRGLLRWGNLTDNDVTWVPAADPAATARLLMEGRGDITFAQPVSPFWMEAEASPGGLRFIDLPYQADPAGAQRLQGVLPDFSFGKFTSTLKSATGIGCLVKTGGYNANAAADTALIYNLVKFLDQNNSQYANAHPYGKMMTLQNTLQIAEQDWLPLHDGTVKYLKEIGKWTDKHEARRQANIKLLSDWEKLYQDAIKAAEAKGISVDPKNQAWFDSWKDAAAKSGLPSFKMFAGL
jgi:hypothetical protein